MGYRTASTELTLSPGASATAALRLEPDAPPPSAPPPVVAPYAAPVEPQPTAPPPAMVSPYAPNPGAAPAAAPPPVVPADSATGHGGNTLGYALLGAGGVGALIGTVAGVAALGKKSSLDKACTAGKGACPQSAQSDIDSMKSAATISTVGFVAGGASLLAGLVILLSSGSSSEAPPPHAKIEPWLGLGAAGARGAF